MADPSSLQGLEQMLASGQISPFQYNGLIDALQQANGGNVQGQSGPVSPLPLNTGSQPMAQVPRGPDNLPLALRTAQQTATGSSAGGDDASGVPNVNQPGTNSPTQQGGNAFGNMLLRKDGKIVSVGNTSGLTSDAGPMQQIDQYIKDGYVPITPDGKDAKVTNFDGGYLINGLPINTFVNGTITPQQIDALKGANQWDSTWNNFQLSDANGNPMAGRTAGGYLNLTPAQQQSLGSASATPGSTAPTTVPPEPPVGVGTPPPTPAPTTTPTQPAPAATGNPGSFQVPTQTPSGSTPYNLKDWQSLMSALMNNAQGQGATAQGNLAQVAGALGNNLNTNETNAANLLNSQQNVGGQLNGLATFTNAAGQQNYNYGFNAAGAAAAQQNPAINAALAKMGTTTGLDPQTMAALNAQALEGPQAAYQNSVGQLKSRLLESGAAGGGTEPGSASAIASGYGPLLGQLTSQQENLQQQAALANQNYEQQNLALNNQTALGALGASNSLLNNLNTAYNPNAMINSTVGNFAEQGNIYNPANYVNNATSGLSNLTTNATAGGQLGIGAANTTANLAQTQGQLQPGSFQNTLYASLLSALTNGGSGGTNNSILGSIIKGVGSVINPPPSPTGDQSQPAGAAGDQAQSAMAYPGLRY